MPFSRRKKLSRSDSKALYPAILGRAPETQATGEQLAGNGFKSAVSRHIRSSEFRWSVVKALLIGRGIPHDALTQNQQTQVIDVLVKHAGASRSQLVSTRGKPVKLLAEALSLPKIYRLLVEVYGLDPARQILGAARRIAEANRIDIRFNLDAVAGMTIRGFAYNRDNPEGGLTLGILINDMMVSTCQTNKLRRDLQEEAGGDGLYGFEHAINLPPHMASGPPVRLSIMELQSGQYLLRNLQMLTNAIDELAYLRRIAKSLEGIEKSLAQVETNAKNEPRNWPKNWNELTALVSETRSMMPFFDQIMVTPISGFAALKSFIARPEPSYAPDAPTLHILSHTKKPDDLTVGTGINWHLTKALYNTQDSYLHNIPEDDLVFWCPESVQIDPIGAQLLRDFAKTSPNSDVFLLNYDQDGMPCFQSRFDYDHFLAINPYRCAVAWRAGVLGSLSSPVAPGPDSAVFDLMIQYIQAKGMNKITETNTMVVHLPVQQIDQIGFSEDKTFANVSVASHFDNADIDAQVSQLYDPFSGPLPNVRDIRWPRDNSEKLAVIIPTRNALDLMKPCIESLLKTAENAALLDVIIVDNQSDDADTLAWFQEIDKAGKARVLQYNKPFNWSAINNFAVGQTDAEHLLFLNNDTLALSAGWDVRTLENLQRPEIGALGARLLYEDGTIQHSGVILYEDGVATHEGAGEAPGIGGYFGRTQVPHRTAAVTGAYLATPKSLFEALDGFDEENLSVTFNDIDYCLRVREAGHHILYLPQITFNHLESKSRGYDYMDDKKRERALKERAYMEKKWAKTLADDPYYPPIFARTGRAFTHLNGKRATW